MPVRAPLRARNAACAVVVPAVARTRERPVLGPIQFCRGLMPSTFSVNRSRARCAVCFALGTSVLLLISARASHGQVVPVRPLGRDVSVYQPAPGEPGRHEAPSFQNPTGDVSLRETIALALFHNPRLAAFAWEVRAREAAAVQASQRPNPALEILLSDFGARQFAGGGINEAVQRQVTIQLSQLIELGGKRAARLALADRERDLAAWDYETVRIDVLTDVSRAFTDVLAAQETVSLTEETAQLVEHVQESVSARVIAGVVSPIEETRATVALAAVRIESARARRALAASRTRLALLWGSSTPAFRVVVGDLTSEPAPLPRFADLMGQIEQSPELARWAAELSQREAALAVERSQRVPDVSVAAGYRRFTDVDSNAFLVGASIPLPFFDRNRGGIEEARSRVAKVYEERRAAQARGTAALADAYEVLASAYDEVAALRSGVLPGSEHAFDAVTEGYRLGRFDFLDVLDAQRTLIGAGRQHLRALSDYHKAVANVERLIGAPLPVPADAPTTARE